MQGRSEEAVIQGEDQAAPRVTVQGSLSPSARPEPSAQLFPGATWQSAAGEGGLGKRA